MNILYNPPINIGKKCDSFDIAPLEEVYIKNIPLNHIKRKYPFTVPLINNCNIIGKHKKIMVDLKIKNYKSGYTCIPGWHCDTTTDANHANLPEVHHILTCDLCPTEFLINPIEIPYSTVLKEQLKYITEEKIMIIPSWTWVSYGRTNFHRGPKVIKPGKRFLIRLSETNF